MVDIFCMGDARSVLRGKSVVFLGDSLNRHLYQDMVTLLCSGKLTSHEILNKKGKRLPTYLSDELVRHGDLVTGRDYKEEREMVLAHCDVALRFYFLTKCWSHHLQAYLRKMKNVHGSPDLVIVLSCLWDINRWGSDGIRGYKKNCGDLLDFIKTQFGGRTQVLWLTCPPISADVRGGLVVEGMKDTQGMRFNVLEGNLMVATTTAFYGYDVLDLHNMMMHQKEIFSNVSKTGKGMDATTMRALGNHLVILADSMGNIIPETKGAVSKTGKASSKVKKSVAKDADKCGNGKPKLNKKGDQMQDKKVVVKKTSTKVVSEQSKVDKSTAKEISSKDKKIKTNTKEKSEKVVKSLKKEKIQVLTEEKGQAKVNKKLTKKQNNDNATATDDDGTKIEKKPVVKKSKVVELEEKAPPKKKQNVKATTEDVVAKKPKVEKVPSRKTNYQCDGDVSAKIEKKPVAKSKDEKKDKVPPKKKLKTSTSIAETSESEFSINVQINMVEKKKKTAKK